jgi:hypothetical protein
MYKCMSLFKLKSILVLSQIKAYFSLAGLVMISLALTSCSEYLKGKPAKNDFFEIKSDSKLECFNSVADDLQKFLDSEATNTEIDQTINCINTTLTELQTRVEGRTEASSFTASEVYEILATFAKSAKVTSEGAENILALKAALLGGDKNKITKQEINLLKNYLNLVKIEAKNLKPYIKLFYFKSTEKAYTKAFIQEAFLQLNTSIKSLYRSSQLANSSYSFEDFKTMLINVLNLTDDKKAMVEVFTKVNAVLNGTQTVLTEAERLSYIDNITEFLRIYAIYANGYAKFEISTSADLNETITFIDSALALIENSLQYKKTQMITVASLDGLVSSIVNSNILSYKIPAYTAAMFYRTVLVRVFESGANASIMGFSGLKSFHIRNIKREIGTYKVYSKLIERVANEDLFASRGITEAPLGELQRAMGALSIASEQEILSGYDSFVQSQIINNVNDLRSEFIESTPIIYKNKKIAVATNQNTWGQKWKDLARGLYVKMLARLIMQGWGQIYPMENIQTNYVTELQMTKWYSELKAFFVAIKSFDPRTYNSGSTSVKTGNLFTRSGNGDARLTFKELSENLGIILTSSSTTEPEIATALADARCNLPELDVFDKNWNHETCFYQVLRANYKFYFSNLPHLVAYLDTLNEAQFRDYIQSVVDTVRLDEANRGVRIETSDISSMNSLLTFIEGVYIVLDTNNNWALSEAEIKQAYPKFKTVATEFAYKTSQAQIDEFTSWKGEAAGYGCFSEEDLIRESFVYLIYNGKTPSSSNLNSFPCFSGKPLINFSGEVNRRGASNALKSLKQVFSN